MFFYIITVDYRYYKHLYSLNVKRSLKDWCKAEKNTADNCLTHSYSLYNNKILTKY